MEIIEIIKMLPKGTMLYADVANLRNVVLGGVLDGNCVLVMSKIRGRRSFHTFGMDDCGASYSLMRLYPAKGKTWKDMEYVYKTEYEDADGNTIEVDCFAMPRIDGDVTVYLADGEEIVMSPEEFKESCRKA